MVRVLIAEDEHIVVLDLTRNLEALGYEVCGSTDNAAEAVRLAETTAPDVILMDIRLRGAVDGIQAGAEVWSRWRIPVVFLTSYSDRETVNRAKAASPFGFVVKPFRRHELDATIRVALHQHRLSKEIFAEKDWLQELLGALSDGVVATDRVGRVEYMNRVAENLSGWKTEEAIGRMVEDVLPLRGAPEGRLLREVLQTGQVAARHRCVLLSRTSQEIDVEAAAAPVHNGSGELTGAVSILADRTQARRAEREREWLIAELQRSNQELSTFAHAVSHDLQAPIRSIKTRAALLERQGPGGHPCQAELLQCIARSAEQMDELVRALLRYAEAGQQQVEKGRIPFQEIVDTVLLTLQPLLAETESRVTCEEVPELSVDRVQMQQVLQNLLTNAVKYRAADRPLLVKISSERRGDCWRIRVADNGQGIEPQYFSKVFEPLKRLHGACVPGTGLGLATCRKIVERHGGRIWVESDGKDMGATFCFEVPD